MARKTATFVKCDESSCRVAAEVYETNEAPEGWYLVQLSSEDTKVGHSYSRQNAFEFHSLKCLEKWAKNRRSFQTNGHVQRTSPETIRDLIVNLYTSDPTAELTSKEIQELIERGQSTVDRELRGLVAANQLRIVSESPNVYTTDPNADWVKAE